MKKIFSCRRSSLALIGIITLAIIAVIAIFKNQPDVASAIGIPIAGIVGAVGASNAYEKKGKTNVSET